MSIIPYKYNPFCKLYYKTLKLRRGAILQLIITYACTLKCDYCSLHFYGNEPKAKVSTIDEWKDFILRFPTKLKEVHISGGEPTLVKWMPEFANWLLDQGFHVSLYSNVYNPEEILKIKKSYRFKVIASYHHIDRPASFDLRYRLVKKKHQIEVWEIGEEKDKVLQYSRMKPFTNGEEMARGYFSTSPDRHLYISCQEHLTEKSQC